MDRLTPREGRVLASLVEKQLTIPQHYPLTLHALVAACNQTSSRDPVTAYGESEVLETVESLKAKRLARAVLPSHGRSAVRYRHVLDEAFGLDAAQLAVLSVLTLRGPQTTGELRTRTERMADIASMDHELELLTARDDRLVERVPRRPGQKEDRWSSLLAAPFDYGPGHGPDVGAGEREHPLDATLTAPDRSWEAERARPDAGASRAEVDDIRRELGSVRAELTALRAELDALRSGLGELRSSLGG